MSGFQQQTTAVQGIVTKLTGSTATTIVDGTLEGKIIHKLQFNENFGSTPNLSVDIYNIATTTAHYLGVAGAVWRAKAVTAGQSVEFTDIVAPLGYLLRATSSDAAGKFDVVGVTALRSTNG